MWQKLVATDHHLSGLFLRATLGIVMFPHGAQKLFGWFGGQGLIPALDALGQMGVPQPVALLVVFGESLGALLLLLGFLTRLCAMGIALIMTGAVVLVHWPHGFFMDWFNQGTGQGFEFHLLAIGIALALMARGGGYGSLDLLLTRENP